MIIYKAIVLRKVRYWHKSKHKIPVGRNIKKTQNFNIVDRGEKMDISKNHA